MQPATIKREARRNQPGIRMSANNVRDAIRLMKTEGIVRPVSQSKRQHPLYELTDVGEEFRVLLQRAEVPA